VDKKRITRAALHKIGKNKGDNRAVNSVKKDYQKPLYPSLIGAKKTYAPVENHRVSG
jgi:hypothetical protein